MKLLELRDFLNTLPKKELEGNLIVTSQFTSSCVDRIKRSDTDLYYLEDEDPSELITEAEMKIRVDEEGDEWEDCGYTPYIKKGAILLIL